MTRRQLRIIALLKHCAAVYIPTLNSFWVFKNFTEDTGSGTAWLLSRSKLFTLVRSHGSTPIQSTVCCGYYELHQERASCLWFSRTGHRDAAQVEEASGAGARSNIPDVCRWWCSLGIIQTGPITVWMKISTSTVSKAIWGAPFR